MDYKFGKKGKGRTFVRVFVRTSLRSAQVWITQLLPHKITIPAFHLVNIHQTAGGTMASCSNHMIATYYSFIDPERMKG